MTAQARRAVAELYPDARGAVLGGSAATGLAGAGSDLDIGVLLPEGHPSGREVVRHEGRQVEVFRNAIAELPGFFEWDRGRRRATVVFLYAEGLTLTDPYGHVARARERARAVLESGPPPLSEDEWQLGRYVLTCRLDDLGDADPAERFEQLALADALLREAAHLLTAHHRAWTGIGKWLPRRLLAADPARGGALLSGHRVLAERADPAPLLEAAHELLDLVGGPLREGYRHTWTR
ncbi:nucleotidyltransferase domain-containing protein [Streptomyces sp. XM4193]|uniref:nucleotidyltransferase domain-containing protein n=1 Tax=Streptomyces sp. XM4193 TaxID=2929782 RepID=UPI001FF98BF6|nr:nucleotidyltransferase domain-containing protein [Streptomyces sp. XM4193]MCK1796678.1 nucleotidyltransferase domain-containing protein [Streptomyces sp. XM4193]